jgi:hypothetical protein
MSLPASCVSQTFEKRIIILCVIYFPVCHTINNICLVFQDAINEFYIPPYKVSSCRGNGPNMVLGIQESDYKSIPYFLYI